VCPEWPQIGIGAAEALQEPVKESSLHCVSSLAYSGTVSVPGKCLQK
jgi:hypothetical protein